MPYLLTFSPWIVYALIPSGSWKWAGLVALVISVGVIAQQTKAGRSLDALIIEIGSAVFFAAVTVVAFADPHSGLHPYSAALSSASLAVIAGVSLAIRRPFTLGIAKQSVPREFWSAPLFLRTNVIITAVWTVSFAISAIALAVIAHNGTGSIASVAVQIAGFAIPMVFTIRYAASVRARAQAGTT